MPRKKKMESKLADMLAEQELNRSFKKINEDFLRLKKALALASSAADNLGKNLYLDKKEDILYYSTTIRMLGESIDHYANRIACLTKYLPNFIEEN